MQVSSKKIVLLSLGWLITTDLLVWAAQVSGFLPVKVLLFLSLVSLPGVALLKALRVKTGSPLEKVLISFGLSILVLMASGLMANTLHLLGVVRPLELLIILTVWNIVTLGCIAAVAWLNPRPVRLKYRYKIRLSKLTWGLISASTFLPLLVAGGAFRLNNGGDATVALAAICWAAGIIATLFWFRNRLHDTTIAWCIFTISLAILLMTSLRSWDITGHDIAREFRVYTLAHFYGYWDLNAYRDPYNACLSITILPEIFAKFLNISGLVVFKFIMQIIFAICPVVIYVLLRKYASKLGALVGFGLFISYPTFINDSAMLTRQGVAYLFFSLALLVAVHPKPQRIHKLLFLLCGFGVVLSHYSTAYMFVGIFAIALVCKFLLQRLHGDGWKLFGDKLTILSPTILAILGLTTFLWYAQITRTSDGLVTTLARSVANIPYLLSEDNKSTDTSAALLLATQKSQLDIYQSYLAKPVVSNNVVNSALYNPDLASDDMPLTSLGERLRSLGIDPAITTDLRQYFAKLLQLLVVLAVCYASYMFVRKKPSALPLDLICLSLAGIALLVIMVVMPNLSINYGVLRTFQQSLIFLVIPLTILLAVWARLLWPRLKTTLATVGMVSIFLLFAGLFAQLLGGVGPPLTLNNQGLYYGLYYTTQADLHAYNWLKDHVSKAHEVRAASYAKAIMHDPNYPFDKVGVLPTQRHAKDYVFLDQAQLVANKFYVNYEGSPLITTFPLNYYNDHTNQIYSTTTTGVYR